MAGPESTGTEVTMFMVLWQRLRHFWNSCTPQALVDKFFQMWQIHLQSEFDEFGVPFFRAYSRMKILGGITTPWRFFGQCSLDLGARPIRNHTYKDRKMYSMWGRTMMKPGLFGVSFFHVSSTQQAGYPQSYDNTNKSQAVGSPSGERSRPPAPPPPHTHAHTHAHTPDNLDPNHASSSNSSNSNDIHTRRRAVPNTYCCNRGATAATDNMQSMRSQDSPLKPSGSGKPNEAKSSHDNSSNETAQARAPPYDEDLFVLRFIEGICNGETIKISGYVNGLGKYEWSWKRVADCDRC